MNSSKKKILIVEDHPIVYRGLKQLFNKQDNLEVCGIAVNAADALKLIEKEMPELATIDISLKDSNGLELIKDIALKFPKVKMLVISMFDEAVYAERAVSAGAKGYIMKQKLTKELLKAVADILDNKIYLSKDAADRLINRAVVKDNKTASPVESLSDRELEVLNLTGQGMTTQEIADKINLGIKTVETYKSKIKEKLDLKNSNQLIKYAVEWVIKSSK